MFCISCNMPSIKDVGTLVAAPVIAGGGIYAAKVYNGFPQGHRSEKISAVIIMTCQGAVIGGVAAAIDNFVFGGTQPLVSATLAGAGIGAGMALSTWRHVCPVPRGTPDEIRLNSSIKFG
jgi:hypothetical protein